MNRLLWIIGTLAAICAVFLVALAVRIFLMKST